ncbi:MAG: ABC transporter substrate-binding protein [Betaproteobacteria bacterium]|nr:MAG: ABC transporter substrate-binding protein [Betaproteobacteria bacterium]
MGMRMLVAGLLLGFVSQAAAQQITIGLGGDVTSIDPHYHNLTPNNNVADHIFGSLVRQDPNQRRVPGLAESWRAVDDLTWEFKLRKGAKFHDGSDVTAEDVVFSIDRVAKVPNSPGPFTIYTKQVTEAIVVDPLTVRLKTAKPYPNMVIDIATVQIVSKKAAAGASTDDFNSGKAAIGAGPYKLVRYARGDRIELVRNDAYWGPKPHWERVTFRMLTNDASRVAALLAGDVQAIENIPTADMAKLAKNPSFGIFRKVSNRIIYLHMDSNRDKSPFVTDKAGKPLDRNPLKDVRVRRAMSKAINRQAIVDRVMEGLAVPAGQLLPEGMYGVTPNLKPEPYDPEGAKKLLAEAGYPDGFGLTIHAPNNRYVNDEQIAQAVAQMLTRAGIATKVEAMPANVFFSRASKLDFSFILVGWGSNTGEVSSPLKALLATYNKEKGMGAANRGRYSNPKMDAVLEQALATVDDAKREKLLQQAVEISMADVGVIVSHFQVNTWAARKGITYAPRSDERTHAFEFVPAQ